MSSSEEYETSRAEKRNLTEDSAASRELTFLDGAAIKPTEADVEKAAMLPFDRVTIDYEGLDPFPDSSLLAELGQTLEVRVTIPVRADGFDPFGDDSTLASLPDGLNTVLVAGNPAYLSREERSRAIAPRFRAAMEYAVDPWIGTEAVERIALATGATQFELYSKSTEHDLRALRAAGYEGTIAVYAPTILTDDTDEILDAIGEYVSRRKPVANRLPAETATDRSATGTARDVLLEGANNYALVGSKERVAERAADIREAGADLIIGYPARGIEEFGV